MNISHALRSATAVRTGLVAALTATAFIGVFSYVAQDSGGTSASTDPGGASGVATATSAVTPDKPHKPATKAAPFTTADVGACLTWEEGPKGAVSNFEQTSCDGEHRFEVSARENLATYPTSEFGDNAARPDVTRQAQLREELCHAPTLRYLGGRFDPLGRFSIAPILPPADAWANGDRTMLCGLQSTDASGALQLTHGTVASQDQARVHQPGQCLAVDPSKSLTVVDCTQPHQLETTSIVDLAATFPDGPPSVEDQDKHLKDECTKVATDYVGSEESLSKTSLIPYWSTISTESWEGGSHSVNCSLIKPNHEGKGFAQLVGPATGDLLIDGHPPEPEHPDPAPKH
ncbi:septum formation family protein [Corynebacterium uberis]|uniref:septum formation family protein n=1 Tax=Corynebacterium TaxID=1716 RepID=UPI001D0AE1A8|nr:MULTISPECIES: septum formation family protein [Corynebacterium]MCZ9309581.1 septum formation family protein [Corynebacterium sp. c6VSa_13]UDL73392.1 septum formation family protein [Corynebacterium uberis]UDL75729.1 septum formation family protein [Corynebacterium uberis]UDL77941.1 septum formation family protein [Corynebacterium uberis]UDL80225.1 septum formation family protein [Corynebacterium uberis]